MHINQHQQPFTMMMMRLFCLLSFLPLVNSRYSAHAMEEFWIDPSTILENLNEYKAFYIKPHHCVWSECAVDDTDDGYTGDNRDGDEQWYQYRTQEFCANAAYSLYGVKKGVMGLFGGCSEGHFINSLFTYGGADNLLMAVGETPLVYYDESNDDKDSYYAYSNEQCVEIESQGDDDGNDDDENGNSGSGDENGRSSSLGCTAEGDYIIASFNANVCDGNYYSDVIDSFDSYNEQHKSVGCHRIWSHKDEATYIYFQYLLSNSWSCDLDLYPNGCPDPFGKKEQFDFALRTVANGGNAKLAYKNMIWKRPLRILSCVFAILTVLILGFAYYVRNSERIGAKGGKFRGYCRCLWEDFLDEANKLWIAIKGGWNKMILSLKRRVSKKSKGSKKEKKKKKKSSKKKKEAPTEDRDDDAYVIVDEEVPDSVIVDEEVPEPVFMDEEVPEPESS
jgi:hypothetical protein